jgi:outer membrane protein assembly factor BamB
MIVTDGAYYLMLDVEKMKVLWKRPVAANDPTRLPAMRLELQGDYLAVVKRDFDAQAITMLSSRTGELLWKTDPKDPNSPPPVDTMLIRDGKLYGIKPHQGEGFYVVGMDCKTGKPLFAPNEQAGYGGKPDVALRHSLYGDAIVAQVRDRQDFEVKAFSARDGKLLHAVQAKAAGDFGEHGRASATVQNGRVALLGKDTLVTAGK